MEGKNEIFTMLNDSNFRKEVIENHQPILVLFAAEWSGSCQLMRQVLASLAGEFKGKIKFAEMDFDRSKATAEEYEVRRLPTIVIFKNGRVEDYLVGMVSKKTLSAQLEALIKP